MVARSSGEEVRSPVARSLCLPAGVPVLGRARWRAGASPRALLGCHVLLVLSAATSGQGLTSLGARACGPLRGGHLSMVVG